MSRTPQQLADQLNSLHAKAVNIVEGTIAGAALPGGSISFTYRNPVDGQTYTATGTAWNTCSPSRVSALKLPDGSWIVIGAHESATVRTAVHTDRRARPKPQPSGNIKVLFSVIEGAERVFYVGGDRPVPKKIHSILASYPVYAAKISNIGDGDKFSVGLNYGDRQGDEYSQSTFFTITPSSKPPINYTNSIRLINREAPLTFIGHGFWTQNLGTFGYSTSFLDQYESESFSQYLGTSRRNAGAYVRITVGSDGGAISASSSNAIAPTIDKPSALTPLSSTGSSSFFLQSNQARLLGKSASTAVYRAYSRRVPPGTVTDGFFLVNCLARTEILIGGDAGWRRPFPDGSYPSSDDGIFGRSLNLIQNRLYWINFGDTVISENGFIPESAWEPTHSKKLTIDIYDLGANTTKRSITAKVFGIKKNAQIHSLSYHP